MRRLVKRCAHGMAQFLVLPILVAYWVESLLVGKNVALCDQTEFLAIFPGLLGRYLRVGFLSMTARECHRSASIGFCTTFSKQGVCVGENVYIGANCSIGLVTIEQDVLIASGVYVTSGAHQHNIEDLDTPIRDQGGVDRRVTLGAGCWIGANAVVMADVGKGSVVAAGAVVAKPLPEYVIAGGIPARVIRSRLPSEPTQSET